MLKGGEGAAKTRPQKVELADVNLRAARLHFLGGVGAWAWPCCGENKDLPVAKVTVHYEGGKTDEFVLKNGVEFVDHIDARHEAPGSTKAAELLTRGQVRWFTKTLTRADLITKLTLESYDNLVAPVFVAITAELSEPKMNLTRQP